MTEKSLDEYGSTVQFCMALGKIYSRTTVFSSGLFTVLLSIALGFGGLLQLGYVESFGAPGLIDSLTGVEPFAVAALGVSVSSSLFAYLHFGLGAPPAMKSLKPVVANPITYLTALVVTAFMFMILYLSVTFLGDLHPLLGLGAASILVLLRYLTSNFVPSVMNTPTQMQVASLLFLVVPVVALGGGFFLGALPNWTYDQWSVALLYCVLGMNAVSGPIDMVNRQHQDTIHGFAKILARRDAAQRRSAELRAQSPDRVPIDLPDVPQAGNLADAATMSNQLDEFEAWLDAHEEYLSRYEHLDGLIDGGLRHQAATGDRSHIDTVVATFAEQFHPRHYDDPDTAVEAGEALGPIINAYDNGYVTEPGDLTDRPYLDELLDISGPQPHQLSDIEDLFEPVQTA